MKSAKELIEEKVKAQEARVAGRELIRLKVKAERDKAKKVKND